MRKDRLSVAFAVTFALVAAMAFSLSGCCVLRGGAAGCPAHGGKDGKAALPAEIDVRLSLKAGDSWKGRFVSTGDVKRTLKGADGAETSRSKSLGLELTAEQVVREVNGNVARIEVRESSARILQEGKYVDVPFRRLNPPAAFSFTLDVKTGKTDFSAAEKAWRDWMATVKDGPAGDILGKTFRLEGYLAQLKDLYAKPFTRLANHRLSKEYKGVEEKDFLLPFVGPSVDLGPMTVRTELAQEGFEVRGRGHFLAAAGRYSGEGTLTPEQAAERLEDFGLKAPSKFASKTTASGNFKSTVDLVSGREIRTDSRVVYTSTATFDGKTFTERIDSRYLLEPEE
jgi:hypothetical protein